MSLKLPVPPRSAGRGGGGCGWLVLTAPLPLPLALPNACPGTSLLDEGRSGMLNLGMPGLRGFFGGIIDAMVGDSGTVRNGSRWLAAGLNDANGGPSD